MADGTLFTHSLVGKKVQVKRSDTESRLCHTQAGRQTELLCHLRVNGDVPLTMSVVQRRGKGRKEEEQNMSLEEIRQRGRDGEPRSNDSDRSSLEDSSAEEADKQ